MRIKFKKISLDFAVFYEVDGIFSFDELQGKFIISNNDAIEMLSLSLAAIMFSDDVDDKLKNIYLIDENDVYYSFLNCSFSKYMDDNNLTLKFSNCCMIVENYFTPSTFVKINKLKVRLSFYKKYLYFCDFKNISFKYSSSKSINIYNNICEDKLLLDIEVSSTILTDYHEMSFLLYKIVELIFLLVGTMPHTESTIAYVNAVEIKIYYDIVDKYNDKNKPRISYSLNNVNSTTINKTILRKFINFRKSTKIIFDVFLNTVTKNDYVEIKNSNLIYIVEGIKKTLFSKYNSTSNLRDILYDYFNNSDNMKSILSRRDKNIIDHKNSTGIFIYKSVNHRNYLTHLDVNKYRNVFVDFENVYAFLKYYLSLRIYILEYVGVLCDTNVIDRNVDAIEQLAKVNRMRYSFKKN